MSEQLVIGVDGGGTRTRVALVSAEHGLLGVGHSGSGNYHDVGLDAVRDHMAEARDAAFQAAGRSPDCVASAFLGMASVAASEDRARVADAARAINLAQRIEAAMDLRVALMGGLSGRPGIAVIAGTGSSVYGRTSEGVGWQAGGFGSYLDDGGSASEIGRRALVACVHQHDGRGPKTPITQHVYDRLKIADPRAILYKVDGVGLARSEIAALAPLVTMCADAGDEVALGILEDGADALAHCVETVARELSMGSPEVAMTGGLCAATTCYRSLLDGAIQRRVPDARPVDPELPSVIGAALCALEAIDRTAAPELIKKLVTAT